MRGFETHVEPAVFEAACRLLRERRVPGDVIQRAVRLAGGQFDGAVQRGLRCTFRGEYERLFGLFVDRPAAQYVNRPPLELVMPFVVLAGAEDALEDGAWPMQLWDDFAERVVQDVGQSLELERSDRIRLHRCLLHDVPWSFVNRQATMRWGIDLPFVVWRSTYTLLNPHPLKYSPIPCAPAAWLFSVFQVPPYAGPVRPAEPAPHVRARRLLRRPTPQDFSEFARRHAQGSAVLEEIIWGLDRVPLPLHAQGKSVSALELVWHRFACPSWPRLAQAFNASGFVGVDANSAPDDGAGGASPAAITIPKLEQDYRRKVRQELRVMCRRRQQDLQVSEAWIDQVAPRFKWKPILFPPWPER